LIARWPWLRTTPVVCPICARVAVPTLPRYVIGHLNDFHNWSREAIADWIEQFEPAEATENVADAPTERSTELAEKAMAYQAVR
jgi:hypothetical protein